MKKHIYIAPIIECIKLDNEISLQLQSDSPPNGPGEITNLTPEYMNTDPTKNALT